MNRIYEYFNAETEQVVFGNLVENQIEYLVYESGEEFFEPIEQLTQEDYKKLVTATVEDLVEDNELYTKIDELITYHLTNNLREII